MEDKNGTREVIDYHIEQNLQEIKFNDRVWSRCWPLHFETSTELQTSIHVLTFKIGSPMAVTWTWWDAKWIIWSSYGKMGYSMSDSTHPTVPKAMVITRHGNEGEIQNWKQRWSGPVQQNGYPISDEKLEFEVYWGDYQNIHVL